MNETRNCTWWRIFLVGVLIAASILNVYLSHQPRQSVGKLELSTLNSLSEYDDY
ncbi:hypothetical protein ACFPMF_13420 [Larkinella bovis]|uniref:Uncharacterized protein n=1 Tax=Larkinella bovis TaxID=683041 RepID=A0ABW0I9W3_9BACT